MTINKRYIFIISGGRTGTHFFGYRMSQMIEGCASVHEPDVLGFYHPHTWYKKIEQFGFLRLTLGKFLTRYSARGISVAWQSGKLSDSQVVKHLIDLRKDFVNKTESKIFLEANPQFNGVLDLLPQAFPNSRIVFIIRDPRSWVRSHLNKKIPLYSKRDYISWYRNGRLTPYHLKDDPYRSKWRGMSPFEKLCWAWARDVQNALKCADKSDSIKIFRFEDIFNERKNYEIFFQMLEFVVSFPDGFKAKLTFKPELLFQKIDSTDAGEFPKWIAWNTNTVKKLDRHCGDLMRQFSYGVEPKWQEKL